MKTVVLLNDLNMTEVIGRDVYKQYVVYLQEDIKKYFINGPSPLAEVPCPGCGSQKSREAYKKMEMNFKVCAQCGSYFVSPRPSRELLENFYKNSQACQYWRQQISRLPDEQLYYIYGSRVNWITELADEFLEKTSLLLDFQSKYPFFLKHLEGQKIFQRLGVLQPQLFEQSDLLPKDILVGYGSTRERVEGLASIEGQVSMLTAFESLERMPDPKELFTLAGRYCQKGGLLLITTSTSSGFEYQILGDHAPNINPINRMNLLSIEALTAQIEAAAFEVVELSTPGRLDVEIVRRAIQENKNLKIDPFWKYVFEAREEKTWQNLQDFLQANRLSSHLRIAARKK